MSEKSKSCGVCDFETEESYMGLGMCMGIAAGMFIQQVVFKGDTYIGMLYAMIFGQLIGSQIHVKVQTNSDEILEYMKQEDEDISEYMKNTRYIDSENEVIVAKAKEMWDSTLAGHKITGKCSLEMFLFLIVNIGVEHCNDYNVRKIVKKQWREEHQDEKCTVAQWEAAFKEYNRFYTQLAKNIFEFVRDEITHSIDADEECVTYRASDVLINKTGICHAKANLLAALCRANGIPAGICFQYKKYGKEEPVKHCLHAYNAVYIDEEWIKIDARVNKEGVDAQFPEGEGETKLAFGIRDEYGEYYIPWIYKDADESTMEMLAGSSSMDDVKKGLVIG